MHLIKLNQAKLDISSIEKYTQDTWGEKQKFKYLSGLNYKLDLIATLPYLGRVFYCVNNVELRVSGYKRHNILYFIYNETVVVYRIKSQKQHY